MASKYNHLILDIRDQIGVIKLNRPEFLNAWNEALLAEMVGAVRELNEHPDTVFTVLTGEGRFFSAGADIRGGLFVPPESSTSAQKKLFYMRKFSAELTLFTSLIHHSKIIVLALNGPGVGGGAAWFTGLADIVLASSTTYLQVPFSALGLVPEFGAVKTFAQSIGVRRANEFLMFGRKCTAQELETWGLINRVFDAQGEGFQRAVREYLEKRLEVNDAGSMLESKRLMNASLREGRLVALVDAVDALAERFVAGVPMERFKKRTEELQRASEARGVKGQDKVMGKVKSSL
ncbi:ClpP/crotonase-like domain-containing protein [Aspergillus karnatakaensis]|uniref:enoyl-CoA hydratase/isomerase family protein n=1 Tax=Aspergillus karnatakaensis TaxID=1810916 RepID=UPI003CCD440D